MGSMANDIAASPWVWQEVLRASRQLLAGGRPNMAVLNVKPQRDDETPPAVRSSDLQVRDSPTCGPVGPLTPRHLPEGRARFATASSVEAYWEPSAPSLQAGRAGSGRVPSSAS